MSDIRPKRSSEELPTNRRQELEEQLAALRDQETVLARTIELVQGQIAAANKGTSGPLGRQASLPARPTADAKDYEARCRQVHDEQKRRTKQLWTELRRLVRSFKNVQMYKNCFDKPVCESDWGKIPVNWNHYRSIIQDPMDLKTVMGRLGDDDSKRTYTSPTEVLRDLRLIHQNAQKYKADPNVTHAANNFETALANKWRDAQIEQRWGTEQQRQQREDEVRGLVSLAAQIIGFLRALLAGTRLPLCSLPSVGKGFSRYCKFALWQG